MPKRKRDEAEYPFTSPSGRHRLPRVPQPKRVEEKLHYAKKLLHRALKLARGFERQKLGRRHKAAVKKQVDVERLDAEIHALKALDLPSTADAHLYKTVLKDKQLSVCPALSQHVTSIGKVVQDSATANVIARLYNSNPVKEAMSAALSSLRLALGIQNHSVDFRADEQITPRSLKQHGKEALMSLNSTPDLKRDDECSVSEIERHNLNAEPLVEKVGAIHEDDIDFDMYNNRVGFSSDEDSAGRADIQSSLRYDPVINLSLSPSPSISESHITSSKVRNVKSRAPEPASTTFLPSLTMGGYWSGSESEPEDDLSDVAPRKNRRGQRARQQIWEKKYGGKAKHVRNPKSNGSSRDQGWDLRRGAQESGWSGPRRRGKPSNYVSKSNGHKSGPASGGNATEVIRPDRRIEKQASSQKPLHPSWEAAKRAKEQKQTMPFAGKKVVFD